MKKYTHIETIAVHGGQIPDPVTRARGIPVWRTTAYNFNSSEQGANLFALKELGFIYTRLGDPTSDVLEKRLAELEGGAAAVVTASGMAAIHYTALSLARAGDEIVASRSLYGGTFTLFATLLKDQGITVHFVDSSKPENFRKAITSKTRFLYTETIGNPALDVADIAAIAKIAHENKVPLVVDSTFTPPVNYRPMEDGADIVIHSLSKWIGGHGSAMGGVAIDSGIFNWRTSNVPLMKEPDPSYHGLKWAFDLPESLAPIAFALRYRTGPLRNLGACLSPDNSWIFLQGLESLPVRMRRHNDNALAVALWLKSHSQVAWVRYPGLQNDSGYSLAQAKFPLNFGGMVVFGIKGDKTDSGRVKGQKFLDNLTLFSNLANVGDTKSLAIHPASTTHSQLSQEEQNAAGLPSDLIRLSIGLEHIDDIIADLETSLKSL
ncbi:MAG TPA: O-acetylhomoserine aminocarboxypropyltransferase/cysteine synthase family protein [Treponemataceae bacterium]|nr:O-acetylhomoserine aminocarboxypropyltransferase/cysteine synthase family protein [Treponemataceae bacterium]